MRTLFILFSLILTFPYFSSITVLAKELSIDEFKPEQRIGIYPGSFDPVHIGHEEAIRYSLSQGDLDYVIVIPDTKYNPFKPFRSPPQDRQKLLRAAFANDTQILTTSLRKKELLRSLRNLNLNLKLVGVIGSDNVIRHRRQNTAPHFKVDEWVVITRTSDIGAVELKCEFLLGEKPVKVLPPDGLQHQGSSSTHVRRFLGDHSDFFDSHRSYPTSELPLNSEVAQLIRTSRFYSDPGHNREEQKLIRSIHVAIFKKLLSRNEWKKHFSIVPLSKENHGLSGDLLFFLQDDAGEIRSVIKVLTSSDRNQRVEKECKSFEFLSTLPLTLSAPVQCLYTAQEENFAFMGMSATPGKTLKQTMIQLNQQPLEDPSASF